jgi:3-oxoacyl-[acyl-carrier protein] reductase
MLTWRFSGQRALVMGGSCQIGLDLADLLIAAGLQPILTYRSAKGCKKIQAHLDPLKGCHETVFLDLSDADSVSTLADRVGNGIDYLVDFAQADLECLVASVGPETVRAFLDAQISARAAVIQTVTRTMLTVRRGRLVYISSTAAARPNAGQGFYAAVKLAAEAIYRNTGIELAGRGITSVSLRPGYVDAGRGGGYLRNNKNALSKVPLGRALTSREVAETIMFLLSDSAVGFNATVLTMDGGLCAVKP